MAKVEQQITINAPAEKVFNYLADITKHGEWGNPGQKLQVEKTSAGPIGQGSTFKSVGQQFGTQNDTVTIREYVPNQKVVYESQGKAGILRHAFEITPSGNDCDNSSSLAFTTSAVARALASGNWKIASPTVGLPL